MGFLGGVIGKLVGSDEAISKGVDAVVSGFDKLIYTGEEKAEDRAKSVTEARGMVIDWMKSTQGQNLARRLLAITITATWLFMYLLSTALDSIAPWIPEISDKIVKSSEVIGDRAIQMNGAMMLILGFYFAAPHMDKIVGIAMNKFSGGKK